jgi:hypothetical protein
MAHTAVTQAKQAGQPSTSHSLSTGLSLQRKCESGNAALQQELTRLFAQRGIPASFAQLVAVNRVNGASFDLAAGAKAGDIGTQIAQSIYGGLGE